MKLARFAVYDDNEYELELGQAPRPRNSWEGFLYHICHGLIMRYPLWKVLAWSWLNRKSFQEAPIVVDLTAFADIDDTSLRVDDDEYLIHEWTGHADLMKVDYMAVRQMRCMSCGHVETPTFHASKYWRPTQGDDNAQT
jgi:hypothetical protein